VQRYEKNPTYANILREFYQKWLKIIQAEEDKYRKRYKLKKYKQEK